MLSVGCNSLMEHSLSKTKIFVTSNFCTMHCLVRVAGSFVLSIPINMFCNLTCIAQNLSYADHQDIRYRTAGLRSCHCERRHYLFISFSEGSAAAVMLAQTFPSQKLILLETIKTSQDVPIPVTRRWKTITHHIKPITQSSVFVHVWTSSFLSGSGSSKCLKLQ